MTDCTLMLGVRLLFHLLKGGEVRHIFTCLKRGKVILGRMLKYRESILKRGGRDEQRSTDG